MPVPVTCPCRHRWEVDDSLVGKRLLCPACHERVAVPANRAVRVRCPNNRCDKAMSLGVPDGVATARCRCPACGTRFKLNRPAPAKPAPKEEVGGYALAAETSVGYLLTREADGFRLTAEEKAVKKRLIAGRLAEHPDRCPACEQGWNATRQRCKGCGYDHEAGKRIVKSHNPTPVHLPSGVGEAAAAGVAADLAAEIGGEIIGEIIGTLIEGLLS